MIISVWLTFSSGNQLKSGVEMALLNLMQFR